MEHVIEQRAGFVQRVVAALAAGKTSLLDALAAAHGPHAGNRAHG
jgi:hypothetical protein